MQEVQGRIKKYLKERGWHTNEPVDLAKSLVIESAELLELFQWHNPKRKSILKDKKALKNIEGELADLFIYCFGMVVSLDLDAERIILNKLAAVEKKYPPKEVKKGRATYLKIKSAYRRNNA